ncbi:60S ribosomal protein L9B, partial [Coemansia sp. BCRC 34490]
KFVRKVQLYDGVKIEQSKARKEELILTGNDVDAVSQSAASIQQATRVRRKDIRKFLDGVYVSHKGVIDTE